MTTMMIKTFVCVGSHWGMIHLLDHQGNNVRSKELHAHTVVVNQISIDQNGDFIASCSDDGKVFIYGLYSTENNHNISIGRLIKSIAIDPNYYKSGSGRRFITGDERLVLHEKTFLSRMKSTVLCEAEGGVQNIKWNGQFVAWASDIGVRVYDINARLSTFTTEFYISGIGPLDNQLVLLAYVKEPDAEGKAQRPQLYVVEPRVQDYVEVCTDFLSLRGYQEYKCNDYHLDDRVQWLIMHSKFEAAMQAVTQFEGRDLKRHTLLQVGRAYLDHLLFEEKFDQAGQLCLKILGKDKRLWEEEVFKFARLHQLRAVSRYLPRGDNALSPHIYEMVLYEFLKMEPQLIHKHNLFGAIHDMIVDLMNLDADQAINMFLEKERVPSEIVVSRLQNHQRYLYLYLDALDKRDGRESSQKYHGLLVQLYADFARDKLLPFLRRSDQYPIQQTLEICQKRCFYPEMVYILDFITYLLQNIGTYVDPQILVQRIKPGLEIPGLQTSLVKMMQDYNLQMNKFVGHVIGRLLLKLYRHGDRAPVMPYTKDPYRNASYWPDGWGMLTMIGKEQHYELGQWLRNRYKDFLPELYNRDDIYVRSTDVDRTLMSAASNLAGLYPPEGRQIWHKNMHWQPIPIHTMPEKEDELKNSAELKKYNIEHARLYNYVVEHSGNNISDPETLEYVYDTLFIEELYNLTLPNWTKEVYPGEMASVAAFSFTLHAKTKEMQRLLIGHDLTVANILMALGVFDPQSPPYRSLVLIELWKDDSNNYLVTINYRNSTTRDPYRLTLPGCEALCPLDKFEELLSPVIPHNWEKECQNNIFNNELALNTLSIIVLGICGILVILLVLSMSFGITYWRKQKSSSDYYYHRLHQDIN
ncbi:hypothetical protein C0J52_03761 [Blattella germanica]|nr:hypothetical protein C0J52_03761 [Blattella germanica]